MKVELCLAEKSYPVPGSTEETIIAVRETSISISEGEFCLICGPSGSGKSTLLALMGGVACPSRGSVLWDGKKTDMTRDVDRIRGEKIGHAFQDTPFFKELTVMENLLLPLTLGRKGSPREAGELLDLFGLADRFDCFPSALSGGEKRRLAVAGVLLRSPEVMILDEPVAYLDDEWKERLMAIVTNRAREQGSTLVITSHDILLQHQATRVFRMNNGCLHDKNPTAL